jgi:outer membrane protein TolC
MFIAYEQLGLLRDEGIMNVKSAVQVNIASVIEAYYNIVQQKKLLAVIDSTIALYKKEMDIAKQQYQIGTSTKLNYLQAEVGYNAQRSAYLRQQVNVTNATVTLNQLIALPVETSYLVSDSIPIRRGMVYDSLKKNMLAQNPDIKISQMNMKVAANNTRIVNALRLPTLSLGLNYGLSRTENSAGLTLLNQTQGLTGGLTLGWTLYNGNIVNIQKKNALLTEMNAKFQSDLVETQTNAVLLEAYQQYNSNLNILKMDEENLLVAKEAVDVALGQFRVGTGNIVQLEQAQASYQTAGSLVVTDRYNSKLSETQLLQQSGLLVK